MMATYQVRNVDELENRTADLSTTNRSINKSAESLQYVLEQIKTNWTNEQGQDIVSIVAELEACIKTINGSIVPVVDKYVISMNNLAIETRTNQSRTM